MFAHTNPAAAIITHARIGRGRLIVNLEATTIDVEFEEGCLNASSEFVPLGVATHGIGPDGFEAACQFVQANIGPGFTARAEAWLELQLYPERA